MESTKRIKLMKFEAGWCMPCKYMSPIVEKILEDNLFSDIELVSINIDDEAGQTAAVEFNIRSIPTLILLDNNNKVINTLIGTADESQVREFLSNR